MVQVVIAILGVLVIFAGIRAFSSKGIALSTDTRLEGGTAKLIGGTIIIVGLAMVGFAIFILPTL